MAYSLLESRYYIVDGVNETLQALNAAIIEDFNRLQWEGVQSPENATQPAVFEQVVFLAYSRYV